jgi:hypothetical protein
MQDDRKEMDNREGQDGTGRINRDGQEANTSPVSNDISEVDQQEGSMHNGALGGNFDQDTDTSGSEEAS